MAHDNSTQQTPAVAPAADPSAVRTPLATPPPAGLLSHLASYLGIDPDAVQTAAKAFYEHPVQAAEEVGSQVIPSAVASAKASAKGIVADVTDPEKRLQLVTGMVQPGESFGPEGGAVDSEFESAARRVAEKLHEHFKKTTGSGIPEEESTFRAPKPTPKEPEPEAAPQEPKPETPEYFVKAGRESAKILQSLGYTNQQITNFNITEQSQIINGKIPASEWKGITPHPENEPAEPVVAPAATEEANAPTAPKANAAPHITFEEAGGAEVAPPRDAETSVRVADLKRLVDSPNTIESKNAQALLKESYGIDAKPGVGATVSPEEASRPLDTSNLGQGMSETERAMRIEDLQQLATSANPREASAAQKILQIHYGIDNAVPVSPVAESRVAPSHSIVTEDALPGSIAENTTSIIAKNPQGKEIGHVWLDHSPKAPDLAGTPTSEINHTILDEDARGSGIGRSMYVAAIEKARANGSARIVSDTERTPAADAMWKSLARDYPVTTIGAGDDSRYAIDLTAPTNDIAESRAIEPQFKNALASRNQMPDQTVNLSPAGSTYVGHQLEAKRGLLGDRLQQEYADTLGTTTGSDLLSMPKRGLDPGQSPESVIAHEIFHVLELDRQGEKWGTGIENHLIEMMSHLNPNLTGGGTAAVTIPWDKVPGAELRPNGNYAFPTAALKTLMPDLLHIYLAGALGANLSHGSPETAGAYSDNAEGSRLMRAAGFTEDEAKDLVAKTNENLRQQWSNPDILNLVRGAAAGREEGLSKTLHMSSERLQNIRNRVRQIRQEAQNGQETSNTQANTGAGSAISATAGQPGGAGLSTEGNLREGNGEAVSPNQTVKTVPKLGPAGETTEGAGFGKLIARSHPNSPGTDYYQDNWKGQTRSAFDDLIADPTQATVNAFKKALAAVQTFGKEPKPYDYYRDSLSGQARSAFDGILVEPTVSAAEELRDLFNKGKAQVSRVLKTAPTNELAEAAVKKYGVTDNPTKMGFILPDGRGLDFSEGRPARTLDHGDVSSILPRKGDNAVAYNENPREVFADRTGAARILIHRDGVNIVLPESGMTPEQSDVILRATEKHPGDVTIDIRVKGKIGSASGPVEDAEGLDRLVRDAKKDARTPGAGTVSVRPNLETAPAKQGVPTGSKFVASSPEEYRAELDKSPRKADFLQESADQLRDHKIFKLQTPDGKATGIAYSITPGGEMRGMVNNGPYAGASALAVKSAFENGATHTQPAWDVNGRLAKVYNEMGGGHVVSEPYDETKAESGPPSDAMKAAWRKAGWKDGDPYPNFTKYEKNQLTGGYVPPTADNFFMFASPDEHAGGFESGKWNEQTKPVPEQLNNIANKYQAANGRSALVEKKMQVDPRQEQIADAYAAAVHAPNDPAVKKSYDALKHDIDAQYDRLVNAGFSLDTRDDDPYEGDKLGIGGNQSGAETAYQMMRKDLVENKHLSAWKGGAPPADHPLSAVDPKTGLTYNEKFRLVHDVFGHVLPDNDFSAAGEESAWGQHRQMFSPEALPALATETRAQTAYVTKHGQFSDQKAAIMPKEFQVRPEDMGQPESHKDLDMPPWWNEQPDAAIFKGNTRGGALVEGAKENGGFTVHPRTGAAPTDGYQLETFPERRVELTHAPTSTDIRSFIAENRPLLNQHPELYVGGYDNKKTGKYELNISGRYADKATAVAAANKLDQISIWDNKNQDEIFTKGSGKTTQFPDYPLEDRLKDLRTEPESFEPGKVLQSKSEQGSLPLSASDAANRKALAAQYPKGSTPALQKYPLNIEATGETGRATLLDFAGAMNKWAQQGLKPNKEIAAAMDRAQAELKYQLANDNSGLSWYKKDTSDAIATLKANGFPELENPTKNQAFRTLWGITSYGVDPDVNMTSAGEAWKQYQKTGKIPLKANSTTNWPGYSGIQGSITLLNKLLDEKGEQGAMDWLYSKHPVSEIREQKMKTHGTAGVPGKADEEKYGAFIFGPKAGAYTLNLQGVSDHTTVDVWGARMIRRWTGTLTPDSMDKPVTPEEARNFHNIVDSMGKDLGLDNSTVQAVLWQYEHDLYAAHGVGEAAKSYKGAAEKYVQKQREGTTGDFLREQSGLFAERLGKARDEAEKAGENAPVAGSVGGASQSGQEPPEVSEAAEPETGDTSFDFGANVKAQKLKRGISGLGKK